MYDFRNPGEGYDNPTGVTSGFAWADMDRRWEEWSPDEYRIALAHPIAQRGFQSDWQAMNWADTGVLLLPSGRSAHIEVGYFVGAGKDLQVLLTEPQEPELMYLMATLPHIHITTQELFDALAV